MAALVITDTKGDIPAIEIKAGSTLIIHRGIDCLYISEEETVAGKVQGITREIATVPRDLKIKVVP